MALNINGNLGLTPQNNVFVPKSSDIVKGDELTNVAKEILSANPRTTRTGTPYSRITTRTNQETKLADANVAKQNATNKTGYDVTLSQNALTNINNLKAMAAQVNVANITKAVDGKIHINSEKTDFAESKHLLMPESKDVEIFGSAQLGKDRRGPGGFYIPLIEGEEENQEEDVLNVII